VLASKWRDRALCLGRDTNEFFPEKYEGPAAKAAKAVCDACPARRQCLKEQLALPSPEDKHGIFGGMTPGERRKARKCHAIV
jgi:WhiB family redox-sensing transcriptional regulator